MLASYMKARKTPFHRGVRIEYFSPHVHLYGNIEFSRRRIQGILTDRIATDTQWHQGRRTGRQLSSQVQRTLNKRTFGAEICRRPTDHREVTGNNYSLRFIKLKQVPGLTNLQPTK